MTRWLLLLLTVACDSGQRPVGHGSGSAAAPTIIVTKTQITYRGHTTTITAPNSAECPASYPRSGPCKPPTACSYAEGSCYCGLPPHCGGDAPPPATGPTTWQCAPTTRDDGCPGSQPADGDACETDGKSCDYTCACMVTATCTHAGWHIMMGSCKP